MSENNLKNEVYDYQSDKVKPIDFDKWLIDSRRMGYKIENSGYSVSSYKLEVRSLYYEKKTYAFNVTTGGIDVDCLLSLLVEEDGLISGYLFYLHKYMYEEFLKKYLQISINNFGKNGHIEVSRLIINLFNDVLKLNEEHKIELGYWNQWHFTPWISYQDVETASKVLSKFKGRDLVKLTNEKTGVVRYGCLNMYADKKSEYWGLKCYSLDYDERDKKAICFKFFYPPHDWQQRNGYKFEKASIEELTDKQKEMYEYYKDAGLTR